MKFLDLFAGIGGFRLGLERAGHQAVGYVEWDKYARKSYENMYNTKGEWTAHDITKVTDGEWRELKGRVDIISGGFPCQAFSIAGYRKGFDDTRGTLFYEIARAAKEIQPSFIFLENVKGLFSHDKGQTFGTIIQALDELGYVVEWGLFNSKFWGVPQNRERVFILATRKDVFEKPKLFNLMKKQEENGVTSNLLDILEDTVEDKFYLSEEQVSKLDIKHSSPDKEIKKVANRKGYNNNTRTYDPAGISGTLDTAGGGGREVHIKVVGNTSNTGHRSHDIHDPNGISPTIAARDYKGAKQVAIIDDDSTKYRIRKLTPKECFRLQGFSDDLFEKAQEVNSNSQLYKQAGNSVTVNVIEAIAKSL